jgi:hypothetical protein
VCHGLVSFSYGAGDGPSLTCHWAADQLFCNLQSIMTSALQSVEAGKRKWVCSWVVCGDCWPRGNSAFWAVSPIWTVAETQAEGPEWPLSSQSCLKGYVQIPW